MSADLDREVAVVIPGLQDESLRRAAPLADRHLTVTRATRLLPFLAVACGGDIDSRATATFDTLANGTIVVRNDGDGVWDATTAWRLVEELRIGSVDEGPGSFTQVVTLEVDRGGRIYVVDQQAPQIRVFDSGGGFVRVIGRPGRGPGEFVGANGLAWDPAGRLWVVDQRGERYTLFDTTGRVLETHTRGLGFSAWRWEGVVDTAGRVLEDRFLGGARERPNVLLRFNRSFSGKDTFPLPWSPQENLRITYSNGYSVAPVPFSPRLAWRLDPTGFVWFCFGDTYRIVQRRLAGDTVRIIERTLSRIAVTGEEIDSAVQSLVTNISRHAGGVDIAAQVDQSRIPGTKPAVISFYLDDSARVWVHPAVQRGASAAVLDVFDRDGRLLGRVSLPFRFSPYAPVVIRDDNFYTVTEGVDDVPNVVRARIVRGPSGVVP